uniref:Uncharacterized protein n=1 Tax=mine drainage metagenome TaxID=410659 RepID=E6PYM2_9ZZZZ
MILVPQRINIEEVRVVSADVECEGRIDLEASMICVTTYELRFLLSVNSYEVESAYTTLKIYQSIYVTRAVGSETLLNRLQYEGHRA